MEVPLLPKIHDDTGKKLSTDLSLHALLCLPPTEEIVVDGDPADWDALSEVAFSNRLNYGKNAPGDFDGRFKAAWTDRGIYFCARIKGTIFHAEQQTEPKQRKNNDSLQIYLDTLRDARARQHTGYDEMIM